MIIDHPVFGKVSDYLVKEANDPAPDFANKNNEKRVHDWRTYVGPNVARFWRMLDIDVRLAIVIDADERASNEEWD